VFFIYIFLQLSVRWHCTWYIQKYTGEIRTSFCVLNFRLLGRRPELSATHRRISGTAVIFQQVHRSHVLAATH